MINTIKRILQGLTNILSGGFLNYVKQTIQYLVIETQNNIYREDSPVAQVSALAEEIDKFIDRKSIRIAMDIGSRDAQIAIMFKSFFLNSKVIAFECNPEAIKICRENIKKSQLDDILLVEKAVSDSEGKIRFYKDTSNANIGASSLFILSDEYSSIEKIKQEEIEVDAITLNNWAKSCGIKKIDILWMDLQGAELKALKGMKSLIKNVKFIFTEMEFKEQYVGQPLFEEVNHYLIEQGFYLHKVMYIRNEFFGNLLYINKSITYK